MDTDLKIEEKHIPTTPNDVVDNPKSHWICQTTNLLDDQHIKWALVANKTQKYAINAFNYGNGIHSTNIESKIGSSIAGLIYTEFLNGEFLFTDVVLHKGKIKHLIHRADEIFLSEQNGQLYLKINAFVNMHFSKYNGYICFQSKGEAIISITLYIQPATLTLYPSEFSGNLLNVINGKNWR